MCKEPLRAVACRGALLRGVAVSATKKLVKMGVLAKKGV